MRMGPDASITAADVVNGWDAARLAGAIRRYGEEPHASRIAAAIVGARPVTDTGQLAEVVAGAVPAAARARRHPARRTFQAIRMVVNEELEALEEGLDAALQRLRSGGEPSSSPITRSRTGWSRGASSPAPTGAPARRTSLYACVVARPSCVC